MINIELSSDDILKYVGELYLDNRVKDEKIYNLESNLFKLMAEKSTEQSKKNTEQEELINSLNNEISRLRDIIKKQEDYIKHLENTAHTVANERDSLREQVAKLTEQLKEKEQLANVGNVKSKKRNEVGATNT